MTKLPSPHLRAFAFISGLILAGCSGYTGPRSVVNEDPAVKIPQIRKAVDAGDRSVQPQLVTDLDSNDAAVRFYAIEALARFNDGQRLGYDWTIDDRHERAPAIDQWKLRINGTPLPQPTSRAATEPTTQPTTQPGTQP